LQPEHKAAEELADEREQEPPCGEPAYSEA